MDTDLYYSSYCILPEARCLRLGFCGVMKSESGELFNRKKDEKMIDLLFYIVQVLIVWLRLYRDRHL